MYYKLLYSNYIFISKTIQCYLNDDAIKIFWEEITSKELLDFAIKWYSKDWKQYSMIEKILLMIEDMSVAKKSNQVIPWKIWETARIVETEKHKIDIQSLRDLASNIIADVSDTSSQRVPSKSQQQKIANISMSTNNFTKNYWEDWEELTPRGMFKKMSLEEFADDYC